MAAPVIQRPQSSQTTPQQFLQTHTPQQSWRPNSSVWAKSVSHMCKDTYPLYKFLGTCAEFRSWADYYNYTLPKPLRDFTTGAQIGSWFTQPTKTVKGVADLFLAWKEYSASRQLTNPDQQTVAKKLKEVVEKVFDSVGDICRTAMLFFGAVPALLFGHEATSIAGDVINLGDAVQDLDPNSIEAKARKEQGGAPVSVHTISKEIKTSHLLKIAKAITGTVSSVLAILGLFFVPISPLVVLASSTVALGTSIINYAYKETMTHKLWQVSQQ